MSVFGGSRIEVNYQSGDVGEGEGDGRARERLVMKGSNVNVGLARGKILAKFYKPLTFGIECMISSHDNLKTP